MKDLATVWQISLLIISFFFSPTFSFATIGDRLLLEINQHTFTQRELEIHMAIKSLALKPGSNFLDINETNWLKNLALFKKDMIIFQETRRLGRFQPSEERIQEIAVKVRNQLKNNKKWQSFSRRLGIERLTFLRSISNLIQIEEYRRLKETSKDKNWLIELENKYVIRTFRNAKTFKKISPNL